MSCSDCSPPPQTAYKAAKKAAQKLANEQQKPYYININNEYGEFTGNAAAVKEIVMPESIIK